MDFDTAFTVASRAAMLGWVALIVLPRWPRLIAALRYCLIGSLSLGYATLMFVYFFRAESGGYGSLAEVRALFLSEPVVLAGWLHYLAFDLFVGIGIALRADAIGLNRLLQAPMLVATFMFGPVGLLMFFVYRATTSAFALRGKGPLHVNARA